MKKKGAVKKHNRVFSQPLFFIPVNIQKKRREMRYERVLECDSVCFHGNRWGTLVDFLTVYEGGRVVFTFKNGMEIAL